jgi:hypothetical protein
MVFSLWPVGPDSPSKSRHGGLFYSGIIIAQAI